MAKREQTTVTVYKDEWELVKKAAAITGQTPTEFARATMVAAAQKVLGEVKADA